MVPPSVQRPKLSVSFSGSRPPKLSFSIKINHLVHFGLITVETNSLEIFVWSHYPLWMIHNFASDNFSPFIISDKNDYQWDLIYSTRVHYCRRCWCLCKVDPIYKTVVHFRRKLYIYLFVMPQWNYQTKNHLLTVTPIRWPKKWQEIH